MNNLALSLHETANSIEIQTADGTMVADLINEDDCCVTESMRQYAALFVAAPELLAALKAMQKAYKQLIPGLAHIAVQDYANINEAPILAAKAVRKAESGQ